MGIRTVVCAVLVMGCATGAALGDYQPTAISWPGWTVTSSENLYAGVRHTSYPLTHLFDGRADTAWVPSGKGIISDPKSPDKAPAFLNDGRTIITLYPDKPVAITAIRLMTGYNKSPELFAENDREAEIRLVVNGDYVEKAPRNLKSFSKTTALKDSMCWHTVSLDGRKVFSLRIEVTRRHKGTTGDLCLSELELYNGDAKIDMHMPEVVRFTQGDECGYGEYWILRRDGMRLCRDNGGQMGEAPEDGLPMASWSPTGRYLASVDYDEKHSKANLCVVETSSGKMVLRRPVDVAGCAIAWKNDQAVQVVYYQDGAALESHKPATRLTFQLPPAAKT